MNICLTVPLYSQPGRSQYIVDNRHPQDIVAKDFSFGPRRMSLSILGFYSIHFNMVTYPSANGGPSCLTSVILRELVFPTWYGRIACRLAVGPKPCPLTF